MMTKSYSKKVNNGLLGFFERSSPPLHPSVHPPIFIIIGASFITFFILNICALTFCLCRRSQTRKQLNQNTIIQMSNINESENHDYIDVNEIAKQENKSDKAKRIMIFMLILNTIIVHMNKEISLNKYIEENDWCFSASFL